MVHLESLHAAGHPVFSFDDLDDLTCTMKPEVEAEIFRIAQEFRSSIDPTVSKPAPRPQPKHAKLAA
ncbi:MAG: hypothetical protein J0H49_10740 [Acidobacteria bacterium]|nr:hypothetical protein [Acidobacteriota bacterium]